MRISFNKSARTIGAGKPKKNFQNAIAIDVGKRSATPVTAGAAQRAPLDPFATEAIARPAPVDPDIDVDRIIAMRVLLDAFWVAGALTSVVDLAASHAREREQFGRPIGSFGEIRWRIADLAVARGAALYGEKKELERMVGDDLRSRGRLRDGAGLDEALPADLDAACRRVADAYGVPLAQVRRAVEIQVDTVVSRGFGVLAVNSFTGRLEPTWLVHRNDRLPIRARRSFGTVRSDQEAINITVVEQQGQVESDRVEDAKVLINGRITGIPPGFGEGSEVQVTFEMGFDGVLHVFAFHVEAGIPLEVCPTSNVCTGQVAAIEEHPLPVMLAEGLVVTVNTDDPPMFGTTLTREYLNLAHVFGLGAGEIAGIARNAVRASFMPEAGKAALLAGIDEALAAAS